MKKLVLFVLFFLGVSCSAIRSPKALVIVDDAAVPAHTAPSLIRAADLPMDPTEFMSIIEGDTRQRASCEKGDLHCMPHYMLGAEIGEKVSKDAVTFLQQADAAKPARIMIEIDSPGGDVDEGFKIMRAIESADTKIICVVDGKAQSMAYFILQSCPVRIMTSRSSLMTHKALIDTISPATIDVIKRALADLEATSEALAHQGQRRLKISLKEYKAKVEGTNWFMADVEAFNVGAVDCVFEGTATEARKQLAATGHVTCSKGTIATRGLPDPTPKKK